MHGNKSAAKVQDFKDSVVLKFFTISALLIFLISVLWHLWPDQNFNSKKVEVSGIEKSADTSLLICNDPTDINLSPRIRVKTIAVRKSCLYSKINPQRLGGYKLKIDLPKDKAVKYYVIKKNKIIGPLDSPAGKNNEFDFGNAPFAIMGYDGVATLRLIHP